LLFSSLVRAGCGTRLQARKKTLRAIIKTQRLLLFPPLEKGGRGDSLLHDPTAYGAAIGFEAFEAFEALKL